MCAWKTLGGLAPRGSATRRFLLRRGSTAAAGSLIIAACGPLRRSSQVARTTVPPGTGPVTLQFTHWWAPPPAYGVVMEEHVLPGWARRQPRIKVESVVVAFSEFYDKLLAMLVAGTPPDVTLIQPFNFTPLHARGAWAELTPYVRRDERSFQVKDFFPEAMTRVTKQDKLYGLPVDVNVTNLFYNRELLDAAGVKQPAAEWTWDTWLDAAKRLTRGEGSARQFGGQWATEWEVAVWSNGGEVLDKQERKCLLNQPPAYEGLQWLADLRFKQQVSPTPAALGGTNLAKLFVAGRLAMFVTGTGFMSNLKAQRPSFAWDVAVLPKGKLRKGYLRGASVGMPAGARQHGDTWEFLQYFEGPEVQALWATPGELMPAQRTAATSPAFLKKPPDHVHLIVEAVPYCRDPHYIVRYQEMNAIVNRELDAVLNAGMRSAREATQAICPQVDALLAA